MLGVINKFIVQWFFIRICKFLDDSDKITHYGIIFPIVPLTGWGKPYKPTNYKSVKLVKVK